MGKEEMFSSGVIRWEFNGSEVLRFKDLDISDKFICMPSPGDDAGHGGFKGTSYIFMKIEPILIPGSKENAVRLSNGIFSSMPPDMPVIRVR